MLRDPPLLSVTGLSKTYSAPVLCDVDFELRPGEVHALVGENGAGKSTLARILAGLVPPTAGEMRLRDLPYVPRSKADAESQGIRLVMQELNLIGTLSIAENLCLDRLPNRFGWIDYRRLNEAVRPIMEAVGLGDLDPSCSVGILGVGQQQLVEIAAGISRKCQVLILDEPTAALTNPEINRLFVQLQALKKNGVGLIYISHRLDEIQRIADRITVLRDGRIVATRAVSSVSTEAIVRLMVGRDLVSASSPQQRSLGPIALEVKGLCAGKAVRNVDFNVRAGEILGFAGLMGSGRTETMRAIFGADRPERGEIYVGGASIPASIRSPRDAVQLGMAFVTEDRKAQGLLLPLSIRENTTLIKLPTLSWRGWIRPERERSEAIRWVDALRVRSASVEQPVVELSGGNQQKVVIAKWLALESNVLIFDEPTRGIDVGAKFEIYALLTQLAAAQKAVIIVSSDLKELLGLCDRLVVMSAGAVAATFLRGDWSEERVLAAAFSGYHQSGSNPVRQLQKREEA